MRLAQPIRIPLFLLACPALCPAQLPVVAVVSAVRNTTVHDVSLSYGSTIYSEEVLKVGPNGDLRLHSGRMQLHAGPNSELHVSRLGDGISVELVSGSLVYSNGPFGERLTIHSSSSRFVVSSSSSVSLGSVEVISGCGTRLYVAKGAVAVTSAKEILTVWSGQSYMALAGLDSESRREPGKSHAAGPSEERNPEMLRGYGEACAGELPEPDLDFGNHPKIRAAVVAVVALAVLFLALESSDRP